MKQETTALTQWFKQKKENAQKLLLNFTEPIKDKQEIGLLTFDTFSIEEQKENKNKKMFEFVSLPFGITCFLLSDPLNNQNNHEIQLLSHLFGTLLSSKESIFHAFHYAHLENVLFVHIPKGMIISKPLHLKKTLLGNSAIHHVVVVAEPLSSITIIDEEYTSHSFSSGYVSSFVEIFVQENAEVTYVSLQNYDSHLQHHIERKATAAKDARINWVEAYFGGQYTKSNVTAVLEQDGAASTNTTVFFGDETQKFDIMSRTIQRGKHTFADMNTIGVVSDSSRSMCRGLIKIMPESFGSCGHQKIKTLLMNRQAQANAIPSMQIDNFDVRATHESSVGQISKEKLFYLMSRGLTEQEARVKIVQGYFTQLTKCIQSPIVMANIQRLIYQKLKLAETLEDMNDFEQNSLSEIKTTGDIHA